jgi:hypothetical protein
MIGPVPESVSPAQRVAACGQSQLQEAGTERQHHCQADGRQDVLMGRAKQHEGSGNEAGPAGGDSGVAHHCAHRQGNREMEGDYRKLVGQVAVQPKGFVQPSVNEDGKRRPVTILRPEQIVEQLPVAPGEQPPDVTEEPVLRTGVDQDRDRDHEVGKEQPKCDRLRKPAWPSRFAFDGYRLSSQISHSTDQLARHGATEGALHAARHRRRWGFKYPLFPQILDLLSEKEARCEMSMCSWARIAGQ